MAEFERKNGKWVRNNSDGTQTQVTRGADNRFHWTQPDGKRVKSKKDINLLLYLKKNLLQIRSRKVLLMQLLELLLLKLPQFRQPMDGRWIIMVSGIMILIMKEQNS